MVRRTACLLALLAPACGADDAPAESTGGGSTSAEPTSSTSADSRGGSTSAGSSSSSTGAAEESGSSSSSTTGAPSACWDDLEFGAVEVVHDGFEGGSEGIAFSADGALVVTTLDNGVGTLWMVSPDGGASPFSTLPYALGLAPRSDGGFVVASIGELMAPDGGVYEVDAQGQASLLAEGIDSPNFVALAPDGTALISDDFDTRVFHVAADGTVSTVIEDVPSPNGIAYSPSGDAFYVASTFSLNGELTRYDVDDAGLPIEETAVEILHTGPGSANDGIAVDADGNVYVLANLPGEIWRVDGAATELQKGEIVVDGLDSPASIAFGRGDDFDPCSGYVTELFGTRVVRVVLGIEGAPLHG